MKLTFDKNLPEDFSLNNFYGVIYKIICLVNLKCYIGQTTGIRRIKGYMKGQCSKGQHLIYSAIQKYGKDNFEIQILDVAPNQDVLNFLENFYIKILKSNNLEFGYNIREGGNSGGKHSKESNQKNRLAHLGKPSLKKGIKTGKPAWNRGLKRSLEERQKQSKSRIGIKYKFTDEQKRNACIKKFVKNCFTLCFIVLMSDD